MKPPEPEEPPVFATDMTPSQVQDRAQLVETPLGRVALVFDPGNPDTPGKMSQIVAIDAWCPHLDGPLWEGTASGGEIACPWHRWRYSLSTGQCTWAPSGDAEEAAETEIRVFPTRVGADGRLEILIGGSPGADSA